MAVAGNIAWGVSANLRPFSARAAAAPSPARGIIQVPDLAGVFRGRELTRKDRRIASGLAPVDHLIDGGIVRGRISEIVAECGAGKTSLAAAFAAHVTRDEAAAWIGADDDFDPASIAAAGVELARLLWVSCRHPNLPRYRPANRFDDDDYRGYHDGTRSPVMTAGLKAAEWILAAGGFGLAVLDFGALAGQFPQSAALRLARAAERSGAAVLVLAPRRMCGTFAALSLALRRERACFSRIRPGAPALFDGLVVETRVARNKLGGAGRSAQWHAVIGSPSDDYRMEASSASLSTNAPQRYRDGHRVNFAAGRAV